MKKSFLKFLTILSKTMNWSNMTDFFMDNFTSDVVGAITVSSEDWLPCTASLTWTKHTWDKLAVVAASAQYLKTFKMVLSRGGFSLTGDGKEGAPRAQFHLPPSPAHCDRLEVG